MMGSFAPGLIKHVPAPVIAVPPYGNGNGNSNFFDTIWLIPDADYLNTLLIQIDTAWHGDLSMLGQIASLRKL
jgi:hypothetical protein